MAATSEVGAVPNPRCAGTCDDGVTACGAASDCDDGAACAFPDACLPGFAGLIEAVVPEGPGGVDDPATWSCGAMTCRVDGDALAFASPLGIAVMAQKDLVLERGRRYLVRAEMRADEAAWGWLEVTGEHVDARAPEVVGTSAWAPVSLVLDLPAGTGPEALQLRLHASGAGELGLRRVVVYVIGDYGVWLRLSLVEPSAAVTFRLGRVLRHVDTPPGPSPRPCPDGPAAGCIAPRFASASAAAGEAGPWIEVSDMFAGGERATLAWDLEVDGAPSVAGLVVQAEVAWAPSDDAVIWSERIAPGAARVGLVLPEGRPAPDEVRARIAWVRDLVARDRTAFTAAAARPERVTLGMEVDAIDDFDRWGAVAEDLLALEVELGLGAASFMTEAARAEDHARAAELGLGRQLVDASRLLPADAIYDLDLGAIAEAVRSRAAAPEWIALVEAHADPTRALALIGPRARAFAGPAYRDAFHAWLTERAPAEGGTPADLGGARYDALASLEGATTAEALGALRPDPRDAVAARRFGWAWRFWQIAIARAWSATLDAWREASGRAWRTPAELDGTTGQRAADGIAVTITRTTTDDCAVWDLGFAADHAAGAAASWRTASYPLIARVDATRGDLGRALIELMARGFDHFDLTRYGPHDLAHEGAGGGLGVGSRAWLERVARAAEVVAATEDALAGARREASPIVMLGAEADPLWTDARAPTPDELGWHMALSQAHVPVDVMPESEIAAGLLEGPDAPRRVLFVLRKHVSRDAFVAIRRWVEAGGTLVLGPELATHDELGQLDIERATWLAIAPTDAITSTAAVQWLTADGLATFAYTGAWFQILGVGATTIAVIDEDRPVVVRVPRGRGRILALGLAIGEAYRRPTTTCERRPLALPPRHPEPLSESMRRAMTSLVGPVDALRTVMADDPRVSLHALSGAAGPVVVAVSWASAPIDLVLSSAAWRGCSVVHEHVDDYDLPVVFGSLLMRVERAAVITWDPDGCERPAVVEPVVIEDDRAEDVRPRATDEGCAGGGPATGWLVVALALAVTGRARGRARSGD